MELLPTVCFEGPGMEQIHAPKDVPIEALAVGVIEIFEAAKERGYHEEVLIEMARALNQGKEKKNERGSIRDAGAGQEVRQ